MRHTQRLLEIRDAQERVGKIPTCPLRSVFTLCWRVSPFSGETFMRPRFAFPIRLLYLIAMVVLSACTDERIIFRDRELFAPVQSAANGFVG